MNIAFGLLLAFFSISTLSAQVQTRELKPIYLVDDMLLNKLDQEKSVFGQNLASYTDKKTVFLYEDKIISKDAFLKNYCNNQDYKISIIKNLDYIRKKGYGNVDTVLEISKK